MTTTTSKFPGLDAILPDLKAFYRDLHEHPELSFQEHRTATAIADKVSALGYAVTTGIGGTGVAAVLDNGSGPTVLLRADIDALPVHEETGLPYASRTDGVMHACGHDLHATSLLGALHLLADSRNTWSGKVIAVFQPAEEIGQGAQAMIDDGLYDKIGTPDVVLAQHTVPAPVGFLGAHTGIAWAATDALRVILHGRGAHGSRPQDSVDPVVMAAATVMRLQTIVSREIAATDAAVVTVGVLRAGTKDNIIPGTAEIQINIRTFDPGGRQTVLAAVQRIVKAEAAASGAPKDPEISVIDTFPLTVNDAEGVARTTAALRETFGADHVFDPGPNLGSEDAGIFATAAKAHLCYWFFGILDPARFGDDPHQAMRDYAEGKLDMSKYPAMHTSTYAPALEPALTVGVQAMTTAALAWLGTTDH